MVENSSTLNKDGGGIYFDGILYKSGEQACINTDIPYELKKKYKSDTPIIAHVRAATVGTSNKKVISADNSHPFESEHYILEHNGSLDRKTPFSKEEKEEFGDKTDSEVFLLSMEKNYSAEKKFEDIIKETMEEWEGKFAFIIRDKTSGVDYIVRGKSADLYISHLVTYSYRKKDNTKNEYETVISSHHGYVINTQKNSLDKVNVLMEMLMPLNGFNTISFTDPILLEKETIFRADKFKIEKIADITENDRPVITTHFGAGYDYNSYYNNQDNVWNGQRRGLPSGSRPGSGSTYEYRYNRKEELEKYCGAGELIYTFLIKSGLGLWDVDYMIECLTGRPTLFILDNDLPVIVSFFTKLLSKCDVEKLNLFLEMRNYYGDVSFIYETVGIQYPYVLDTMENLVFAATEVQKLARLEGGKSDIVQ